MGIVLLYHDSHVFVQKGLSRLGDRLFCTKYSAHRGSTVLAKDRVVKGQGNTVLSYCNTEKSRQACCTCTLQPRPSCMQDYKYGTRKRMTFASTLSQPNPCMFTKIRREGSFSEWGSKIMAVGLATRGFDCIAILASFCGSTGSRVRLSCHNGRVCEYQAASTRVMVLN